MKPDVRNLLVAVGATVAAYAPFFSQISVPFSRDWTYFNALSLVVRSIVLHFRRFPLHNPWVCGGLDLLANPQTRIFSPMMLLDLAFTPQWANMMALVAYAVLGFVGMRKLLCHVGVSPGIALVGATLYINCSWFGLHFAEGHIAYGAMQLLPLMMYLGLRCGSREPRILLGLLAAVLLLDGQMYVVIFGAYLLLSCILFGLVPRAQLRAAFTQHPFELLAIVLAAGLLAVPKVLPVVSAIGDRRPSLDFYAIPRDLIAQVLFVPFHTNIEHPEGLTWNFHEFGCYLSPVALVLVLCGGLQPRAYWRRAWPFLLGAIFWFWVGSGWLQDFNPWWLVQKIPLLNNAHVQSRVLLLMFLFFVILVSLALTQLRARGTAAVVCVSLFLVVESFCVRTYPMQFTPQNDMNDVLPTRLITTRTFTTSTARAWWPGHYYQGAGTATCGEPSFLPGPIAHVNSDAYRGEAYALGETRGTAEVRRYTPGRITLHYALENPGTIELNTNALFGWRIDPAAGVTTGRGNELLRVEPAAREGTLRLRYWPPYMPLVFSAYAAGVILFGSLYWRARKSRVRSAA
ncbi:MAG TPA: hypothetical protein VJV78_30895 [Polyangiales bacterium]|nr:hypothetical protein [Polyangiales bacterium]